MQRGFAVRFMFRNILWPVDPAALGAPPLPLLRALNPSGGAYVRAMSVLKPTDIGQALSGTVHADLFKAVGPNPVDVRNQLRRLCRDLPKQGFDVDCEVVEDSPLAALRREIQSNRFDLLLIRSRNAQENGRSGIGGLTADLLLDSPIPVCCVRNVRDDFAFRHLLVATDLSITSALALETALGIAETSKASVTLVHLLAAHPLGAGEGDRNALHQTAKAALKKWRQEHLAAPRVPVVEEILEDGDAAEGIVSYAARAHADLIVIASRGWSKESGAFLGSTARRIVRRSEAPVLVIRGA